MITERTLQDLVDIYNRRYVGNHEELRIAHHNPGDWSHYHLENSTGSRDIKHAVGKEVYQYLIGILDTKEDRV